MDNESATQEKKRILLIEDDEFLSEILLRRLQETGFEARLAKTATDGLNLLKQEKIDLILLDLILPGMNGFEFLKEIQNSNPKITDSPIIVLSNLGQDEEINKAKQLGAKDYLVKAHYTTKEIIEKIKEFLNQQINP